MVLKREANLETPQFKFWMNKWRFKVLNLVTVDFPMTKRKEWLNAASARSGIAQDARISQMGVSGIKPLPHA